MPVLSCHHEVPIDRILSAPMPKPEVVNERNDLGGLSPQLLVRRAVWEELCLGPLHLEWREWCLRFYLMPKLLRNIAVMPRTAPTDPNPTPGRNIPA